MNFSANNIVELYKISVNIARKYVKFNKK